MSAGCDTRCWRDLDLRGCTCVKIVNSRQQTRHMLTGVTCFRQSEFAVMRPECREHTRHTGTLPTAPLSRVHCTGGHGMPLSAPPCPPHHLTNEMHHVPPSQLWCGCRGLQALLLRSRGCAPSPDPIGASPASSWHFGAGWPAGWPRCVRAARGGCPMEGSHGGVPWRGLTEGSHGGVPWRGPMEGSHGGVPWRGSPRGQGPPEARA